MFFLVIRKSNEIGTEYSDTSHTLATRTADPQT